MSMRPNTLTPNQGGEAMENQKVTTKPRLREIICPHRNDRHKKLKICEIILIVLLWLLFILQIVALQQSLDYAPYAPIVIVLIVAVVVFWFFAILEIILFSVLTHKIIQDHQADGHGTEKQHWCRRYVLKRWSCCFLALAMIGSFIMLIIMLSFLFPEAFHGTGDLTIIRIGAVTPTTANFFIRYRHPEGPVYIEYRQAGESSFQRSEQSLTINEDEDYTGVIRLGDLTPATAYEWRFNVQDDIRQFKTNPANGTASRFTFVFGSCFLYNFPYELGATGFEHVASLKPDLVNMMGDFVYADVPILRGKDLRHYQELYRQNFRSKGVIQTFSTIPNYFIWDDHEVYNDWDRTDRDEETFNNAIHRAWKSYVGDANPQMPYTRTSIYYFSYDYGDTSFFFLDTRSFRDKNDPPDGGPKTFLGLEQKQVLKDWLIESTAVFKFVVSTVGITIDLRSGSDTWGEYDTERMEILNFIRDNSISGVIFLSADSHFAYVSELVQPGSGLYEWSVSPIDAFDFDLGGYSPYSDDPFVDPDERKERVVFSDKGGRGSISFIGHVTVDTIADPPFVTLSILNREREIFNMTLTVNQINTLANIKK